MGAKPAKEPMYFVREYPGGHPPLRRLGHAALGRSSASVSALRRLDGNALDVPIAAGDGAYACVEPVNRFVDLCLGKDVENCGDASVGLRSVEVVDAMLRSAKSGRVETAGDPNVRESVR